VTKNEDTFSIQIMDEKEQLHMLLKSDLKQIVHPNKSLMPTPHLTAADLENVLAFLGKTAPASQPAADWKPSADLNTSFSRLRNAASEPQNWLTYWGDYRGTHYSRLDSITPSNVRSLAPRWSFQFGAGAVQSVPLVVGGLMFVAGPQNNATALDARTGRPIWRYTRPCQMSRHCTVMANRGPAILGDRLFMGT
jgi:alcohol dehydrogenase (cytochrome c)